MNDFKVGLISKISPQKQEEITMNEAKKSFFRILNHSDSEKEDAFNLNQTLEKVFSTCGIKNRDMRAKIRGNLKSLLQSGEYLYTLDAKGQSIVSNYDRSALRQKAYQEGENEKAKAKLQSYVEKVQDILEKLPEERKNNKKEIEAMFGEYDWEQEHIWIDLAIEKVLKNNSQEISR